MLIRATLGVRVEQHDDGSREGKLANHLPIEELSEELSERLKSLHFQPFSKAGDGTRTRDPQLGRLTL